MFVFFLNVLTPRRETTRAGSAVFLAFVSNFFCIFRHLGEGAAVHRLFLGLNIHVCVFF